MGTWHDLRVTLFFILIILAVLGLVFAVASGRIAAGLDSPSTSIPARALPEGRVTSEDVRGLRFVPALRGYRMSQVDEALDRLSLELRRRDEELVDLCRTHGIPVPSDGEPAGDTPEAVPEHP